MKKLIPILIITMLLTSCSFNTSNKKELVYNTNSKITLTQNKLEQIEELISNNEVIQEFINYKMEYAKSKGQTYWNENANTLQKEKDTQYNYYVAYDSSPFFSIFLEDFISFSTNLAFSKETMYLNQPTQIILWKEEAWGYQFSINKEETVLAIVSYDANNHTFKADKIDYETELTSLELTMNEMIAFYEQTLQAVNEVKAQIVTLLSDSTQTYLLFTKEELLSYEKETYPIINSNNETKEYTREAYVELLQFLQHGITLEKNKEFPQAEYTLTLNSNTFLYVYPYYTVVEDPANTTIYYFDTTKVYDEMQVGFGKAPLHGQHVIEDEQLFNKIVEYVDHESPIRKLAKDEEIAISWYGNSMDFSIHDDTYVLLLYLYQGDRLSYSYMYYGSTTLDYVEEGHTKQAILDINDNGEIMNFHTVTFEEATNWEVKQGKLVPMGTQCSKEFTTAVNDWYKEFLPPYEAKISDVNQTLQGIVSILYTHPNYFLKGESQANFQRSNPISLPTIDSTTHSIELPKDVQEVIALLKEAIQEYDGTTPFVITQPMLYKIVLNNAYLIARNESKCFLQNNDYTMKMEIDSAYCTNMDGYMGMALLKEIDKEVSTLFENYEEYRSLPINRYDKSMDAYIVGLPEGDGPDYGFKNSVYPLSYQEINDKIAIEILYYQRMDYVDPIIETKEGNTLILSYDYNSDSSLYKYLQTHQELFDSYTITLQRLSNGKYKVIRITKK